MSNRANITFKQCIDNMREEYGEGTIVILKTKPKRYDPQIINVYCEMIVEGKSIEELNYHNTRTADKRLFFTLHEEILYEFGIKEELIIKPEEVESILEKNQFRAARYYGVVSASKRSYSQRELFNKLVSIGFSKDSSALACEYASDEGYIDELSGAKEYVEIKSGRMSRAKIKRELMNKGFKREVVEEAIEEALVQDEESMAYEVASKRLGRMEAGSEENNVKAKERLYMYLLRCGYSYEVSRNTVKRLFDKAD